MDNNSRTNYLWLLVPTGAWLVTFLLIPLAILLVGSFGSRGEFGNLVLGLNLNNYMRFIQGPYLLVLWRSIAMALITTGFCLTFGICVATWIAFSVRKSYQKIALTLFIAPLWTSFILRIYAWMMVLRPTGLVASTFSALHLPHVNTMFNFGAVIVGMVYNYLPYMVLPIFSSLEKVDRDLLEAAADLGASPLKVFTSMTLPLSQRGITAGCIMVMIPALGDYVTPDLLGGSKQMLIGNLIQNQFLTVRDWSFGSAVSTILIIIVGLALWVYLKYASEPVRV